ncbi:FAD-binding oxidoreductase [Haloarchaeobius sp. DYHT-AS-18]|uniref:FAD-binding oxidoreductase n=1 Tax=Haloarchaeobius sp. DYHT-AS-18 TaxID=3446117 RepID=UPI003EC0312F
MPVQRRTPEPDTEPTVSLAEPLESLQATFRGTVLTPTDEGYDEARQLWNGMIDRHPAVIARCSGVADVVQAVTFARDQGLSLAVRGGGHNVAGTAVCDDGLVVDLSEMNGVHVDRAAMTVRAEGGATLGDVDRETQLFGLATPLGVVSKTGIAGLTLNGGVGHLRRKYGLACDNLRSVELVTAAGEVVTASADEHPDLFWAVQGGGGNFGVVTSFEYTLYEVGPEVFGMFVVHDSAHAAEALRLTREFAADAPREASVLPILGFVPEMAEFPTERWGDPMVAILGCHLDPTEAGEATLAPFRELGTPIGDFSGPMPFTDLQCLLDEEFPDGLNYYWKATYLTDLDDDLVDVLIRRWEACPSKLSTVDVWQLGGAIADRPQDASAFWHRDKAYMLTFEANWEDPADTDANVAWVRESIDEVRELPGVVGGYGNFPGFHEDPSQALFGENIDKLVAVKTKYDPENLFRLNQNVEPRVTEEA